jgi:hypothetical protein
MGDFEASISEGYIKCPTNLEMCVGEKSLEKNVYIILQLDKQIKNIAANPTYETDLHQHNKKIRFFFFQLKKKASKNQIGNYCFLGAFFSIMGILNTFVLLHLLGVDKATMGH